ncbi:MAG TPA: HsmA family protein [Spirochaetia bacterium]|nr:HsmA family protein [Spirochaetia bacterium]
MLIAAIALITGALAFYSIGVWGEKLSGRLQPRWLAFFWAGFACDTAGTAAMGRIAGSAFRLDFHGVTGALAIALMAAHAVWATVVLVRKDEKAIAGFHRLSLAVWAVWLVPYLSGVVFGIGA